MKFASKKEVRDRLKEFDAPDVRDYIDPDTMDKIAAAHKLPLHAATKKIGGKDKKQILEENKARVNKMKEMYAMFMKMEDDKKPEKPEE